MAVVTLIPRQILTDTHLEFADWFLDKFRNAIDHASDYPRQDPFYNCLGNWAVTLGVLATDVFSAIVELLKRGGGRPPYMLSRALLDYNVRLRYYINQSEVAKQHWKTSEHRSLKNSLQKMHAYQDWENASDKIWSQLKQRTAPNFGNIPENLRSEIIERLKGSYRVTSRRVHYMLCKTKFNQSQDYYVEHQFRSGFLHGDQIAIFDIIDSNAPTFGIQLNWESGKLNDCITLGNSFLWCWEMLESIERIDGWCYAKDQTFERAWFAFKMGSFDLNTPVCRT